MKVVKYNGTSIACIGRLYESLPSYTWVLELSSKKFSHHSSELYYWEYKSKHPHYILALHYYVYKYGVSLRVARIIVGIKYHLSYYINWIPYVRIKCNW